MGTPETGQGSSRRFMGLSMPYGLQFIEKQSDSLDLKILPDANKFYYTIVQQELFESIATNQPQKLARFSPIVTSLLSNNFKCLFFNRLYKLIKNKI